MSFNITPVASGYQEIHPYSAMNIDSVKINTSLIMMKECPIPNRWLLGSSSVMGYYGSVPQIGIIITFQPFGKDSEPTGSLVPKLHQGEG